MKEYIKRTAARKTQVGLSSGNNLGRNSGLSVAFTAFLKTAARSQVGLSLSLSIDLEQRTMDSNRKAKECDRCDTNPGSLSCGIN